MGNNKNGWISFISSIGFLFRHMRLFAWSLLLVAFTAFLTWLGYHESIQFVDGLIGHFFQIAPTHNGVLGWLLFIGWFLVKYLFIFVSRTCAFYLAFLVAYCLTTPGYVFLSSTAKNIYLGQKSKQQDKVTPFSIVIDLWEGVKVGAVGVLVTIVVLLLNFLPVIGQILAFLLYVFYSALMFVDYPASNMHWTLRQKINWIRENRSKSFRLGVLPAIISMIPVINILIMALFFPLFTVHTTLNFVSLQRRYES